MAAPRRMPPPMDSAEDVRQLNRQYVIGLLCMVALIVAFPIYNAGEPSRRARALAEMQRQNVGLGRTTFRQHCASCHGDDARGGRGAPTLASREFLAAVTDRQMHWLISGGVPGSVMPAYDLDLGGPFTAQEIARVVTYLRSLEEGAPSVAGWFKGAPAPLRVVTQPAGRGRGAVGRPLGDETRGAGRGRDGGGDSARSFEQSRDAVAEIFGTRCAACHGARGEGSPIAPSVHPLRALIADSSARVYAIVAGGVPGTAMLAFATTNGGQLDETAIRALVAWMREAKPAPPPVRR